MLLRDGQICIGGSGVGRGSVMLGMQWGVGGRGSSSPLLKPVPETGSEILTCLETTRAPDNDERDLVLENPLPHSMSPKMY